MTKKILSFGFLLASIICFPNSLQAQTTAQTSELVLSIPSANPKTYTDIIQKLTSIQGVNVLAYCEQATLFLINYDPKVIESGELIARQVEDLNIKYKAEVKTGTSISQLINGCSRLPQAAPSITR